MEWKFRLNWPALVEEAKQRRKEQNLTQQRLATLAEVSTPTVSRFESGETRIELSSVLNIFGVLGMLDKRVLIFPEPNEFYDPMSGIVRFRGQDGETQVQCAISREALDDHFKAEEQTPLKAFTANRIAIEHLARRKYLAGQLEPNNSVLIKTLDV